MVVAVGVAVTTGVAKDTFFGVVVFFTGVLVAFFGLAVFFAGVLVAFVGLAVFFAGVLVAFFGLAKDSFSGVVRGWKYFIAILFQ